MQDKPRPFDNVKLWKVFSSLLKNHIRTMIPGWIGSESFQKKSFRKWKEVWRFKAPIKLMAIWQRGRGR